MRAVPRYAVIGNPIAHSLSPWVHQEFARAMGVCIEYDRILAESDFQAQVTYFFEQGGLGMNVTSPFKVLAFQMAKYSTPRCLRAGSANTLWMKEGDLHADNTDGVGLCRVLKNVSGASVLILGAGGASQGLIPALQDAGARLTITNRTLEKAYVLNKIFKNIRVISFQDIEDAFDIVINATSQDLLFETLPSAWLARRPYCYDLTYYHEERQTSFTRWANAHGCMASDGFSMLVEQAREAFAIWHGVFPQVALTRGLQSDG